MPAAASFAPMPLAHVHDLLEDMGALEWTLTGLAVVVMLWSIYKAVAYTLRPGEDEPDHIKHVIFQPPAGMASSGGSGLTAIDVQAVSISGEAAAPDGESHDG